MDISQLISLVREYPEIYIPSHPRHREKEHISSIWRRIAQELKATEEDVKSKWRNLRSNYMREIRKLKKDNSQRSTWIHFEALSVLKDRQPADSAPNLPVDDPSNYNNSLEEKVAAASLPEQSKMEFPAGSPDAETFHDVYFFKQEEQENESDSHCREKFTENDRNDKDKLKKSSKRKLCTSSSSSLSDHHHNFSRNYNEISSTSELDDPDMMFLRSLLPSIKVLTPFQNLEFKGEVIELLKKKLDPNIPKE